MTVFKKITKSHKELAKYMVYSVDSPLGGFSMYTSSVIDEFCNTEEDALRKTISALEKEVK